MSYHAPLVEFGTDATHTRELPAIWLMTPPKTRHTREQPDYRYLLLVMLIKSISHQPETANFIGLSQAGQLAKMVAKGTASMTKQGDIHGMACR